MGILDAFKQDCLENGNSNSYNAEVQAEVNKQMKAMADYDANPEVLDSQIKFNEEEIPFDERAIAKQLYIEEDEQYPAEADDPEELMNMTLAGVNESDTKKPIDVSYTYLEPCECNEVKVGDKLKVYHYSGFINGECEVSKITKVFDPFTFKPVAVVIVKYEWENIKGEKFNGEMKLTDPQDSLNQFVYFNLDTKEVIKSFTFKDENQSK